MMDSVRCWVSRFLGLLTIVLLVVLTMQAPPPWSDVLLVAILGGLTTFMIAYSVNVGGGQVSLMPMIVAVACLLRGGVLAGWAAVTGILGHAVLRSWRTRRRPEAREPQGSALFEVTAVNIAMHGLGILAGGWVFENLGGAIPLASVGPVEIAAFVPAGVAYLGINYTLAAAYLALRGREALHSYLRSLGRLFVLYEGAPLTFAPVMASIYTRLGFGYFGVLTLALIASSLISRGLAVTSARLQRRVQELGSLQAVGQALSASLDLEAVVTAVHEQVAKLMPASSFYVALLDEDLDEVSFPVVIDEGRRIQVQARRARRGLTEYLLQSGEPLLIARDVRQRVAALGLEQIGREAKCWLGIPIIAGDQTLGMMALQSYDASGVYDPSHVEILNAIAAQAAIAIQNARLYERTDEALTRRVQELDSVLRTTQEGILLLDRDWRVLAANRALAEFIGVAQGDLARHPVDALRPDGDSLIALICYTPESLRCDCDRLLAGEAEQVQAVVVLAHSGRHTERTLVPVRDLGGQVSGWLLLFRDLTEELELAQLRGDMTDMLVHDLRSPMSLVLASLATLLEAYERHEDAQVERLVAIARRSSDRVLTLIDDLLDVGQLERGQLPLRRQPTAIGELFRETSARYSPVAAASHITLQVEHDTGLPELSVDRSLVTRVLANLVDNALKFTPDGGHVRLWATTESDSGDGHLLVGIADTGPGIPLDFRQRLFEKFQQIPTIRGRRRGTGLGLPFCKLVVEAHGGKIWVESEVGAGSTFYVLLPLTAGEQARAGDADRGGVECSAPVPHGPASAVS